MALPRRGHEDRLVRHQNIAGIHASLGALLIVGHDRWHHRLEHVVPHLPKVSSAIVIAIGLGFIAGVP